MKCWNCGLSLDYEMTKEGGGEGVCLNESCQVAATKSKEKWEKKQAFRTQVGRYTEEARKARRRGDFGRQKQTDQEKRDAGWKFTWVSPEEWKMIQMMREAKAENKKVTTIL